jgi:hypothetical protein
MDLVAAETARDDFGAGEWEVAAISIIETGPVTAADIDELETLSGDEKLLVTESGLVRTPNDQGVWWVAERRKA